MKTALQLPPANPLVRLLPPSLVWLFYALQASHFVPMDWIFPGDKIGQQAAGSWQFAGLILPALYLASVGPDGLVERGLGFITVQAHAERLLAGNRRQLVRMGLVWLLIFAASAWLLIDGRWLCPALDKSRFLQLFTYFLLHLGLLSGVGVFLFLAAKPVPPPRETLPSSTVTEADAAAKSAAPAK